MEGENAHHLEGGLPPATPEQTLDLADWLADKMFEDAYRLLDPNSQWRVTTFQEQYKQGLVAMRAHARSLLSSSDFYHVNITEDLRLAQRLIRSLIKLDRLPGQNPIEGLKLLRSAWCDYDVAMHLAAKYKRWCKTPFDPAHTIVVGGSWCNDV